MTRRVVITGMGTVNSLACDLQAFWRALSAGRLLSPRTLAAPDMGRPNVARSPAARSAACAAASMLPQAPILAVFKQMPLPFISPLRQRLGMPRRGRA